MGDNDKGKDPEIDKQKANETEKNSGEETTKSKDSSISTRSEHNEKEALKSEYFKDCFSVKEVGISWSQNSRFRATMEDAHFHEDKFCGEEEQGYFAVYDGHGGRDVVDYVEKRLHKNLEEFLKSNGDDPLEALKQAYLKTDEEIKENGLTSGTTAISALIRPGKNNQPILYIANAGDARAVLSNGKGAIRLSHDHKGTDESEARRISDAGGFIVLNRVNGVLAVTRSLGDISMKEFVIGEPELKSIPLIREHRYLILACDGLWDVISDQEAVDLISSESSAISMSEKLLNQALRKGTTDNVSIMVVILNYEKCPEGVSTETEETQP